MGKDQGEEEAKLKLEIGTTETEMGEEYNAKNNEEKRQAREDRRNWLEKRAAAAEKAAENCRSKELYGITESTTGERRKQEIGVKDKQGVLRTEAREGLQGWVRHFSEILNRNDPTNTVEEDEIVELEEIEEIDQGR